MISHRTRGQFGAILVGLLATAVVLVVYASGGLEWVELKTLDLRFRYANSIRERDDLVRIDIDDGSLEMVQRWPWPRDEQSPLIALPAELGAKAILVDLTYVEPESPRIRGQRHADIVSDPLEFIGQAADPVSVGQEPAAPFAAIDSAYRAVPDYELQTAIADAGNVYLAFHYLPFDIERSPEFSELLEALKLGDLERAAVLTSRIDAEHWERTKARVDRQPARSLERAQLVGVIEKDPEIEPALAAQRLGLPAEFVESVFEPARQLVLRRLVRQWLDEQPQRWHEPPPRLIQELHAKLSAKPFEHDTAFKEALILSLREVLGYRATTRSAFAVDDAIRSRTTPIDTLTPVYFLQARAAQRCGYVVFEPDDDGITRRMPLFVRHEDHVLPQLAFGLACDLLGVTADDISIDGNRLVLRRDGTDGAALSIQIDDQGRTLVPWLPPRHARRQTPTADAAPQQDPRHIPASALWQVAYRRWQIAENQRVIRDRLERVLSSDYFADYQDYQDDVIKLKQLRQAQRLARYRRDADVIDTTATIIEALESVVLKREQRAIAQLESEYERLSKLPANSLSAEDELAFDTVDWLRSQLQGGDLDVYRAANAALQEEIDETLTLLRERIDGKVCLLGYTATSLADMTPIPTLKRAPGVYAHYDLLNGLLSGQVISWASGPLNALLAGLVGILATLAGTWRPPRQALVLVTLLVLLFLALAGWLAFYLGTLWIALTPAVGAMVLAHVTISVYRYMFVERERRQLTTALGQYTSSTLARQMAENSELCKRAETREVTAMFTDLRGFTTISERIGAERTQHVLNISLGGFSAVLLRYEAMINKFIGDGVFAFWNPVIYPQPDHARRACESAIDLQIALQNLVEEQRRIGGDDAFEELVLRIGVATGNAVVGPCGSEQKYDYTCIGDSVNIAARLESGNKFYGTHILVSGPTRDQVGDDFEFRPLGGVRVKGKQQAVPVYELLGRSATLPDEQLAYAAKFGAAVTAFQQREWQTARAAFEECRRLRPEDLAARQYAEETAECLHTPPGEDWTGAIELTEK